jgi:hypothetical protein
VRKSRKVVEADGYLLSVQQGLQRRGERYKRQFHCSRYPAESPSQSLVQSETHSRRHLELDVPYAEQRMELEIVGR